jgi:oligoendopeptidase F
MIAQSPDNAKKYIDMLKAGASAPSVDLLKAAGVDLTTPAPIEFALQEFDKTLTELEALLAK